MANRREWRRQACLADFDGIVSIEIISPDYLLDLALADAWLARGLSAWIEAMPARRPLCLTCDSVFSDADRPILWSLVRMRAPGEAFLSGICGGCLRVPALMPAVIASLKRGGLVVRPIDRAALLAEGGRA
jgi:hypothetical protein